MGLLHTPRPAPKAPGPVPVEQLVDAERDAWSGYVDVTHNPIATTEQRQQAYLTARRLMDALRDRERGFASGGVVPPRPAVRHA